MSNDDEFRTFRFTLMCNAEERSNIQLIAEEMNRSQSDAIRELIRMYMRKKGEINLLNRTIQEG